MPIFKVPNQSLRWLFAELVVIVLGILTAFQVDTWNSSRTERAEEKTALEQILVDIRTDNVKNARSLRTWERQLAGVNQLREQLEGGEPRNREKISEAFQNAYPTSPMQRTLNTFGALRENNQFHIISNKDVQRELLCYYELIEPFNADIARDLLDTRNEFAEVAIPDIYLELPDSRSSDTERPVARIDTQLDEIPTNPEFMGKLAKLGFVLDINIRQVSRQEEVIANLSRLINAYLNETPSMVDSLNVDNCPDVN